MSDSGVGDEQAGAGPQPLPLTVVIPAWNREATVAAAVESALTQRPRPPAEVIVVNDASTDRTAEVAAAAGARVISREANGGTAAARNTGIDAATYEWVALLDSDDHWYPDHLARLWAARDGMVLVSAPMVGSQSGRIYGNASGRTIDLRSPRDVWFPENVVAVPATLVRRDDVLAVGKFREIEVCEDIDMWCQLLERGPGRVLGTVAGVYHEHAGQISADKTRMRSVVLEVFDRYRDRGWATPEVRDSVVAVLSWDRFREGLSRRSPAEAVGGLAALARLRRLRALPRLWRWRAAARAGA